MEPLLKLLQPSIVLLKEEENDQSTTPGSKKVELLRQDSLTFRLICVNVALSALKAYQAQDYLQFDALVGENACQIRAAMLQDIDQNEELKASIGGLIEKLERIRETLLSDKLPEKEEGLCQLAEEEKRLILSHLLNCTRDPSNKLRTAENRLMKFCPEGKSLSEQTLIEVTFHAKRILSQTSVNYVKHITDDLVVKKMLSQEENLKGLRITPLFYNMTALLDHIKTKHSPLMLNIGSEHKLVFQSNEKGELQKIENLDELGSQSAFVIYCQINDQENLEQILEALEKNENDYVTRFILADAADHPLFAGDKKKGIKLFQDSKVSPYIQHCQGNTLKEIQEQLEDLANQKSTLDGCTVFRKQINIAESACQPISLASTILAHHQYQQLKAEGTENKKIAQIIHIYCNSIDRELENRENILLSTKEGELS